jgi:hypothetical protein
MRIPAVRLGVGLCLVLALASCLPIAWTARLGVESRAREPLVCSGAENCDAAWIKAVDWVGQHCAFKVQTRTDSVVETEGPLEAPNTDVACRVERVPLPESGAARIELTPSCGNWFQCEPERDYLQAKFNDDMRAEACSGGTSCHNTVSQ